MIDPGDPGAPKDDPRSVRLNELRTKSKDGRRSKNGLTPEEVKEYRSLVHELVVEQVEQAKQGPPRFAVMTSDSNSFRAMPMRKRAKEAGVDENDPLLLWALEAQEKADWRANPAGWLEMNAAVWAFLEAHFEFRNPWPPQWQRIEELIRKLERRTATDIEKEEFRRLANEVLQNPEYSTFRKRLDPALSLLDNPGTDPGITNNKP
jgi:uncharacterized protein YnzC (UPF0291/DUF896 family)